MNQQHRLSAALFKTIMEQARAQSRRLAQQIKDACDSLEIQKLDISPANVGRFCQNSGPKIGTLYKNKHFRAYIRARQAEQRGYSLIEAWTEFLPKSIRLDLLKRMLGQPSVAMTTYYLSRSKTKKTKCDKNNQAETKI